ncbi:MAG: DNA-3-methyladenine glycosylase [Candidatus Limnocylindrales bacterium]
MTADLAGLLERPTLEVAVGLLGVRLVRLGPSGRRVGRVAEVEAYQGPADQASHARFGQTPRSRPMYGRPGRAYVYLVYGMYRCLNVVTGPPGTPHAVLIRAVEPIDGIELIRAARVEADVRAHHVHDPAQLEHVRRRLDRMPIARLASGPGLVGAAFDVGLELTGSDLLDPGAALHLEPAPDDEPEPDVVRSTRIGINYAGTPWTEHEWRFAIAASPSLSA